MAAKTHSSPRRTFQSFVSIVRRLRRECPWDSKQTHRSLRSGLIEEAYEAVESITHRNIPHLQEELGDLLLHIVLHAVIAEQSREFTLDDIIKGISEKMIRRHPHIFGTARVTSEAEVLKNWQQIKMAEGRISVLEGVPSSLPALLRAKRLQERASSVGFDWSHPEDVWKKVREELEELRESLDGQSRDRREEEFGDLLFSLVNYSRFLGIDPEHALTRANKKFDRRFKHVERTLRRKGSSPAESSLEEMDAIWDAAKRSRR